MASTQIQDATMEAEPKKKGFLSRMRAKTARNKKLQEVNASNKDEKREPTPPKAEERNKSVARDGTPIVSVANPQQYPPSAVRESVKGPKTKSGRRTIKQQVVLDKAPNARESMFQGPPRYDWIDIETAAAIKVQSAFRRNQAMARLEREGKSTAAMRNRNRRRKARGSDYMMASEDAPELFACCGVGLLFGDATEEDVDAQRAYEKEQYKLQKEQQKQREAELRESYYSQQAAAKSAKKRNALSESLEIVH